MIMMMTSVRRGEKRFAEWGAEWGAERRLESGDWRLESGLVSSSQEVPPTSCLLEVDLFGCEVDQSSRPFGSCGRELAGWLGEWSTPPGEISSRVQLGRFFTRHGGARGGWRSVGIMGRAELCGANSKRDTTPEGWLFFKTFEGE